jgi:hypothetical protein
VGGFFKSGLTRIGARCSERTVHRLNAAVNYLEVGRWMRAHGFAITSRVERREELFDAIGHEISETRALYLEFGVFEGDSIRYWSRLLRNPESHIHGFDSFQGLPERWSTLEARSPFSTGGDPRVTDDPRVRFIKGCFATP